MPSSIGPAKAALVTAITTAAGSGVQVVYGYPSSITSDDVIGVLDVEGTQTVNHGGNGSREEEYDITVGCSARRGQDDQREVTERALELMGYVETAVATDPTLGGVVDAARVAGDVRLDEAYPQDVKGGRVSEVTFTIRCTRRTYL